MQVFSAPMLAITSRLRHSEFIIVNMGTDIVRGEPVERWPIVDCLMAFYSDVRTPRARAARLMARGSCFIPDAVAAAPAQGFPLYKAEQYAALRQPLLVNDLAVQRLLWDRRYVYRVLQENGIAGAWAACAACAPARSSRDAPLQCLATCLCLATWAARRRWTTRRRVGPARPLPAATRGPPSWSRAR